MRWGCAWLCFLALFVASVIDVQARLGKSHIVLDTAFQDCVWIILSNINYKEHLVTQTFFFHFKIFARSQPCQQHLQHMGQRALQDVWWWCVPVPWNVWVQPGLRLPRVPPGVLSAREEGREWWKPHSQLCGGQHQWPFIPPLQKPGHCEWPSVSKKPYTLQKQLYFSFLMTFVIYNKRTFSLS